MNRMIWSLAFSIAAFPTMLPPASAETAPPPSDRKPVTDRYHGVEVTEDYRWLETAGDPAVKTWIEQQNRYARGLLDSIPALQPLHKRLTGLMNSRSPGYFALRYRGDILFALKWKPPLEQAYLITLTSPDDTKSESVLLDPNRLDPTGKTAIDWFVPSLDGKLVAVSLSQGGSEDGTLHFYEVATAKELPDAIPRVNYATAGGSAAWTADGSAVYYTRYPHPGERSDEDQFFYQQVYIHRLGTPIDQDTYAVGKEFPKIAEIGLDSSADGRFVLATVANGDGGEYAHFLLPPSGQWVPITQFSDRITQAELGLDGALYLLSLKDAPRGKILRLPLDTPELGMAKTIVEQSEAIIRGFEPTATGLYVVDLLGGPTQIRVFGLDGTPRSPIPVEPVSSVGGIVRAPGDAILFFSTSFTTPPAWFRFEAPTGKVVRTALFETSPVDFSNVEVLREMVPSKDGTLVPLMILRPKGVALDGRNPTLLTGYGGYGISMTPYFQASRHIWLQSGGILAIANLRGGGEFGDEWHQAGKLTKKQNVFDDFIACARYLIDKAYTSPSKLAIQGGSNGGLLMGAVLTQHPELFRAVVSGAGFYDMLRFELQPNGQFNVTELGSVKDPEQFKALYAYSPYHHVEDGTAYPAVFFQCGENDSRVDPMQSRKMIARLQRATASGLPVFLWTGPSGHGIGTALSEAIQKQAEIYAFLFQQLGMTFPPLATAQGAATQKK